MSAKLSCSTLCSELLRGTARPAWCSQAARWAGWFAWGEEEVKVPPTNTAGLKACPTGVLVGVTAHLQPCDLVLHGPSGARDLSYLLEAGHRALSALQPWGCTGVPVSPCALESAGCLCTSQSPGCWESRSPCRWSCLGWGGLSVPGQRQRSSLTASCKLSWGRFLLRFLPPAVLPALALGWRQASSPSMQRGAVGQGDGCSGQGSGLRGR